MLPLPPLWPGSGIVMLFQTLGQLLYPLVCNRINSVSDTATIILSHRFQLQAEGLMKSRFRGLLIAIKKVAKEEQ